jgi:hypothetical protein
MKQFIKHTNSSKENPSLVSREHCERHFSIATIDLAEEHRVTLLMCPLHSSHKLQPMDVALYFSFKAFYDMSVCSWLNGYPGILLSIYDNPGNVNIVLQRTMTPFNILAGFRNAGIFPLDCSVFMDYNFLPAVSQLTSLEHN